MQTDRHAWKERRGDSDKEEINIGTGDVGCVHRWWVEMLEVQDIKMEGGSAVRYRKKVEDRKRYYMSERELVKDKEGNGRGGESKERQLKER